MRNLLPNPIPVPMTPIPVLSVLPTGADVEPVLMSKISLVLILRINLVKFTFKIRASSCPVPSFAPPPC